MVGLLAYMYLVLTFETVLQYYTHLALYLNTIFFGIDCFTVLKVALGQHIGL